MKLLRVLLLTVTVALSFSAKAQVNDGLSLNLGFALGSSNWQCYENLFKDYNEIRPWLTTPADYTDIRYGLSLGIGTSGEKVLYQYNFYGFKSSLFVEGTDTAGYVTHMSYIMKSRGMELMFGGYILNRDKFRIGLLGGITINKIALRTSDKSAAERASMTALRILFLAPVRRAFGTVEDHFFLGGRVAIPIAFGEKHALSIEPFFNISCWKVNLEDDRQNISNGIPSAHDNSYFKSMLSSYGVRAVFCLGLSKD